ncbi:AAA family ATPase [Streptococcus sp. HF-100]|uniref:AAA family ATPase n=1 Tax=Streptococcus sp. HF-100 TaxID=2785791 RepID=UPI0018A09B64|nr:AAA family ATPase [Streptococcus sp. HF-100]MBF7075164.1 AAA family ATPase [Streptococcus sp. HF-100]
MEKIDRIFYRKINPSDFKKLYDIDRPATGGGQTYLEAAGISNESLVDFLSIAEKNDSPNDQRYTYTAKTYTLGNIGLFRDLEFAPRTNRANYKISRQTLRHKHPAWSPGNNGFPVPNTDPITGAYTSVGNFVGIIDDLVILIIRTTYCRYYASFINTSTMPAGWPTGIGLESLFTGNRRGIINFDRYRVEFINNFSNPFGTVVKIPLEYNTGLIPQNKANYNHIVFGAPGTGKSYSLNEDRKSMSILDSDFERVTFHADYSYAQFVGTYKPVTVSTGDISYKFVPGPFMRILKKAYANIIDAYDITSGQIDTTKIKPYLLLIEEINRAHTAAVFGEVFQLLDRNDDGISEYEIQPSEEIKEYLCENLGGTPNEYTSIKLPNNMFIWSTMNSADQGVFPMDTAFKRRWDFKYIGVDEEEFYVEENPNSGQKTARENQGGEFTIAGGTIEWNVLRRAINAKLSNAILRVHEDKLMGPFFLKTMNSDGNVIINDDEFINLFCNKVLMYLFEDAAKTKRAQLFSGCQDTDKLNRYSYICKEFRDRGVAIFGTDFLTKEYSEQLSERDHAKEEAEL